MANKSKKGKGNGGTDDADSCNTDSDIGSIGSNTFRENKRKEFADYENEDDEDLFNHHNNDVLQLFNNDSYCRIKSKQTPRGDYYIFAEQPFSPTGM
jgi:hypothetical protein